MFQLIKYIFVGVINTVIGYITYFVCLKIGLIYTVAAIISQIVGSINSYFWNKFFTFKSKSKSKMEIIRFSIVSALQYLANISIITLLIRLFLLSDELAGLISIGACTVISYLGHKFYSFKKPL